MHGGGFVRPPWQAFRAQKQVRSRVSAYYVCGGYIDSGVTVCNAPRVPVPYLEEAVLT